MSLYQKCRPVALDDVVGSDAAVASVQKILEKKDRPHAYLLTGPKGTGKTTLARIMARSFGAAELSVREVNSANNRGIDTARQIIDEMRFNAMGGGAICYIIDEVHKTTNDWQNAMLKPLEDCPPHVYFFLCTTNPEKIIAPVKSRCTSIKLELLTADQMFFLLRKVNKQEGLGVSKDILQELADSADGSPRDALVLLEQISMVEDEAEQRKLIKQGLPDQDNPEIIELCRALLASKPSWQTIAGLLKKIPVDDPERARYAVLGYMNSVLLGGKANLRAALCMEYFSEPTYNTGKFGLTLAAYQSVFSGE